MNKKHLVAAAIAAIFAAPSAHALDFEINDKTMFSLYGTIEPKIIVETNADGDESTELDDEDSTLGFYAEHRFSPNVTGFGQLEFELDSTGDGDAFSGQDSAFAGLKGNWGKVQAGNFDNVYEDLIIDATEVAEDAEISDEDTSGEDNMIAYYSPDLNGFSFRSQVRIQGEDEIGDDELGFAIAGGYTASNWGIYAGYDDRGAEVVDKYDVNGTDIGEGVADEGTYGFAGVVGVDMLEVAAKYAVQDLEDNDPRGDDIEFTALRATVAFGRTKLYGALQNVDEDQGEERDEVTIGAKHKVYDNLSVWAEAGQFDKENDKDDNYMVGAIFSF